MFGHEMEDESDEKSSLDIIKQLMEQLVGEMSPSKDDFEERLGRKKPDMVAIKVEAKPKMGMDMDKMEDAEEMLGQDLDGDKEMGEDPKHAAMVMGEDEDMSPEDSLKKRLMKLRA